MLSDILVEFLLGGGKKRGFQRSGGRLNLQILTPLKIFGTFSSHALVP